MAATIKVLMVDEDQAGFVTDLAVELTEQAKHSSGSIAYRDTETVKATWETVQEWVRKTVAYWGVSYKPCTYYIGESDLNRTAPVMEGTDGKSLGIAFYLTSIAAQLDLSLQKGIAVTGCIEKTGAFCYPGALEQKVLGRFGARANPDISRIIIGPPPRGSADLGANSQAQYGRILKEFDRSASGRGHLTLEGADALWKPAIVQKIFDGSSWYTFLLRNSRIWRSASPKTSTKDLLEKAVFRMRVYYSDNFWSDFEAYVSRNPSAVDTFRREIPDLARACFSEKDSVTLTNLLNAIGRNTSYEDLLESISREDLVAAFKRKLGGAVEDIFQQDCSSCIEAIQCLIKHGRKLTFKLLKDIIRLKFRPFNTAVTNLLKLLETYFKIDPELAKECYRRTRLFKRVEEAAMQLKPSGRDTFQTAIINLVYSESMQGLAQISRTLIDNVGISAVVDTEITCEELEGPATLKQLDRILAEFTKAKTTKDQLKTVEHQLRKKLCAEAKRGLSEKLHDQESDYQPLAMQIGSVPDTQPTGSNFLDPESRPRPEDHNRSWKDFDSDELLHLQGAYILSSETGTGKTTVLRYLQLKILDQGQFLPIFVHASDLEGLKFENRDSFISHLVELLEPELPKAQVAAFLKKHVDRIKLLVDGLDQIEGAGTKYRDLLGKLLSSFGKNLIIASRPFAVISREQDTTVKFLRLKPFSSNAQKSYFGEHYKRACELCRSCPELMAVPMLAYMVRPLIEEGRDENVRNRTDLYNAFIDYVLTQYTHDNIVSDEDVETDVREAIADICYRALARKSPHVQKIPVAFCHKYAKKHDTSVVKLLKHGLVSLIIDRTRGTDEFIYLSHQSFQEYLAAEWASRSESRTQRILDEMWNPKWKETIKFLAGLIGEDFIRQIYSPGCQDNCIHSRLFLAAECAAETSLTDHFENSLINELGDLTDDHFAYDAFTSLVKMGSKRSLEIAWNSLHSDMAKVDFDCLGPAYWRPFYSEDRLTKLLDNTASSVDICTLRPKILAAWFDEIPSETMLHIMRSKINKSECVDFLSELASLSNNDDIDELMKTEGFSGLIMSIVETADPDSSETIFLITKLNRINRYLSDEHINAILQTWWLKNPHFRRVLVVEAPKICCRFPQQVIDEIITAIGSPPFYTIPAAILALRDLSARFSHANQQMVLSYADRSELQPYIFEVITALAKDIEPALAERILSQLSDASLLAPISVMKCAPTLKKYLCDTHLDMISNILHSATQYLQRSYLSDTKRTCLAIGERHCAMQALVNIEQMSFGSVSPTTISYIIDTLDAYDIYFGSPINIPRLLHSVSKSMDKVHFELAASRLHSPQISQEVVPALCVLLGPQNLSERDVLTIIKHFHSACFITRRYLLEVLKEIHKTGGLEAITEDVIMPHLTAKS